MKYLYLSFFSLLLLVLLMLIGVAFLTLTERKVLSYIQIRKGPNKLGLVGLLQPFSDAIKLFTKEFFIIFKINMYMYMLMPLFMMLIMLMLWMVYPFFMNLLGFKFSILYFYVCLSLMSYVVMIIGWSSNSNYSMLGALRLVSQMISYEVSMILIMFSLIIMVGSFSLIDYMNSNLIFIIIYFPIYLMFIISLLAEMNRTPFDLVEGESELVSGFNIEYYSSMFALIFMSEYSSIMFMSMLINIFFLGLMINSMLFYFFYIFHIYLIIIIRGVLPRMRYDELMNLCWKFFLPISLNYMMFSLGMKLIFEVYLS